MTQLRWLVSFSPRSPWFYLAAHYVVSELAQRDGSLYQGPLWLSPANYHSADVSYSFICHPRYGQWAVRGRGSNGYILLTARRAHNCTSLTVGTSGTWLLYVHIESHLDYGCARDPEDGGGTFPRNVGTNLIYTNGAKTQNTTTI